jgi:hypothetical protein
MTHDVMGDTKRGRERKGTVKRQQRREREVRRALEHQDEEVDFDELYENEELEL